MELNLCMGCMRPKTRSGPCPHCGFDPVGYEQKAHYLPMQTILAGKYLIGRVLGQGGFGITYLAWDLNLEIKVAVKEYYPAGFVFRDSAGTMSVSVLSGVRGEQFQSGLEKFVDEAKRLGKLWNLPGIVSVKDYFRSNHTAYIVMEFAEGETLKEVLKKNGGSLDPKILFAMMRPLMKSLEQVHQAGLIHRDISPDNIMVDDHGRMKLLDFGAARDFISQDQKSLSVMLKPGYAPEEQYRRRGSQGPWTDVYALCATMYRALCGKVPDEALERVRQDTLKPPSAFGTVIGASREAALMKGLAVFAGDRWQSVRELEEALYEGVAEDFSRTAAFTGDADTRKDRPQKTESVYGINNVNDSRLADGQQGFVKDHEGKDGRGSRKKIFIASVLALILGALVFGLVFGIGNRNPSDDRADPYSDTKETQPESGLTIGDAGLIDNDDRDAPDFETDFGEAVQEQSAVSNEDTSTATGDTREEDTQETGSGTPSEDRMRLDTAAVDEALLKYGGGADFALCIFDIPTDVSYTNDQASESMPASALTNICVLFSVGWLCDNGYMTMDDEILFEYSSEGRGVRTQADDGKYFTVRQLLSDMLRYSDNNAANAVMDYISFDNINYICTEEYNFPSVDIQCFYGSEAGDNYASASDIAVMLYSLYEGMFQSIDKNFMEENFMIADDTADIGMKKYLPSGATVLNHNGIRTDQYNEAMIVRSNDYYYISVMISDGGDYESEAEAIARASEIIYEDLTQPWP